MGLDDRLKRLEGSQPPEDCPRCHDPFVVAYVRGEPRPGPCPKCGKTAKFVVQTESEEGRDLVMRVFSGERTERGKEEKHHEDQSS